MNIAIFGASGLAAEVADICWEMGYDQVVFIEKAVAKTANAEFIITAEAEVPSLSEKGYHFIIAIGEPKIRKQVYDKFQSLSYVNIVHPAATYGGPRQRSSLLNKKGNIVFAGARMTSHIEYGNFGIYNQNCTIAHDCIVEDYVTIGPGANISGNVHLAEGGYVGTGAVILQGKSQTNKLQIGRYATIGAGAVVTRSILDHTIVKGIPAK